MQLNSKIRNNKFILNWDNIYNAHQYRIMAMTQTFAYLFHNISNNNTYELDLNKSKEYLKFKVIAENENGIKIAESNSITLSQNEIEEFEIGAINGYLGTSLTFRSKGVLDLYKIYNKNELIAETEDIILTLPYKITKTNLKNIIVEGYTKTEDGYILSGISKGISDLPKRSKTDFKISVIIPVYNKEIFLPRTIDAILSSSMSDLEIILVDDGSTDNSLNICKRYTEKFSCISLIHQENQKVSVARNNGMKEAKGEYIGFVDGDDIVHPFMYEKLYNACKLKNTAIAIAPTIVHKEDGGKDCILNLEEKKENLIEYNYAEMINNKHNKNNIFFVSACNKIVKTNIINQVKFPTDYPNNKVLYEDCAFTTTLYSYIDKFTFCKDAYYIWDKRQRKTVGTLSTSYEQIPYNETRISFIYAYSYPIYNASIKNKELSDYSNFQRLIQSYDKFNETSSLYQYWNEKLKELIKSQQLNENQLIMKDEHLKSTIEKIMKYE